VDTKQGKWDNGQKELLFFVETLHEASVVLSGRSLHTTKRGVFFSVVIFGMSQRVHLLLHLLSLSGICKLVCILYFCVKRSRYIRVVMEDGMWSVKIGWWRCSLFIYLLIRMLLAVWVYGP
jgi:hypothetical protein